MKPRREPPRPPPVVTAVDQRGLEAAVRLFAARFVIADKRAQIEQRLRSGQRRVETLQALPRWLDGTPAPLVGAEQAPAGLEARFGAMVGVYVDDAGARRTTIGGALELGRGQDGLFIGDAGRVALVVRADEPPLLCLRL